MKFIQPTIPTHLHQEVKRMHDAFLTPTVKSLIKDIQSCQPQDPKRFATLSFPVANSIPVVDATPVTKADPISVITALMYRRKPDLLLCAGWSMGDGKADLERLHQVSRNVGGVLVGETSGPKPTHAYRIEKGEKLTDMGPQNFSTRNDCTNGACEQFIKGMNNGRVFMLKDNTKVLFLMCGEISLVKGRNNPRIIEGLQGMEPLESYGLILNPTHTRMGFGGMLNAKREFLSRGRRTYLSASNWDVKPNAGKRQWPSSTIHSCWIDGNPQDEYWSYPQDPGYRPTFVYREWKRV